MQKYVLSVVVRNSSGVLRRVSGLFSRRDYNIDSLTVGQTTNAKFSRMTVVVTGDDATVEQIKKQVTKLIDVVKVEILQGDEAVYRELVLIKVKSTKETRAEILEIAGIFRAKVINANSQSLIIETTGDMSKTTALLKMLEPFEIIETARTGLSALKRDVE